MHAPDEMLAGAEREMGADRTWRAKEILRGALATRAEPQLLERYGRLLDALGERSGARSGQAPSSR